MASGQIINVKLMRGDTSNSWGFRLQGGKDFAQPLSVVKVNPNSLAEQSGIQIGDVILKITGLNADLMRHKEAQDTIYRAGNYLEMTIQRGGMSTWKPSVIPVGEYKPSQNLIGEPTHLTKTSLAKTQQNYQPIGSGHNTNAKPFNATIPALVHKQYNSPVNLYSETNIAETLQAHTEVLASGVKGINFMKPDAPINKESAVYQMVHDEEVRRSKGGSSSVSPDVPSATASVTRHVEAPVEKPLSERQDKANQNICSECERLIVGVFVRIKDKLLHAECFRCTTCGTSLKNVGYFNINDKLYCDIHAKQVASLLTPGADNVPVSNTVIGANPSAIPVPPPSSDYTHTPGLSSPSVVGALPYHRTQGTPGVHHVNSPSSPISTTTSKIPPPVAPKPVFKLNSQPTQPTIGSNLYSNQSQPQSDGYRPISATYSTSYSQHATSQQYKAPPFTASNPQNNANWTGSSIPSAIPGPGQSSIPGSRPAPRRGRGLLKPQITAGSLPICGTCGILIRGPYIVALSKTWCTNHFCCANANCKRPLEEIGFVEESGKLYCELCYETYFAPACAKCAQRIKGDCLNALGKQWHPECFNCSYCKRPFGNSSFYLEDGLPYCEKDWNELFTTKCVGCGFAIEAGDRWVEALNQNYHSNCFKCNVCHKNLEGQSFYAKGGRPFCKLHAR